MKQIQLTVVVIFTQFLLEHFKIIQKGQRCADQIFLRATHDNRIVDRPNQRKARLW